MATEVAATAHRCELAQIPMSVAANGEAGATAQAGATTAHAGATTAQAGATTAHAGATTAQAESLRIPALDVQLTMSGTVADYTAAKLDALKADVAKQAGVPVSQIADLTVKPGSVVVSFTMPKTRTSEKLVADISSGAVKAIGGDEVTKITTKVVSMREEKQDGAKAITLAPTMALGDVPFEVPCAQHGFSIRTVVHSNGKKYAIYFLNCETVGVAALT